MTLSSPKFGNTIAVNTRVKVRKNLSGELIAFKVSSWVMYESFKISFEGLSTALKTTLENFFISNAGLTITYIDHESKSWTGHIVAIDPFTEQYGVCGWTGGFSFEGKRD